MADEDRRRDEDIVDWGVRTGRFTAERAQFWRTQLADDRRKAQVEATIARMAPVLAQDERPPAPGVPRRSAYSPLASTESETPLLDAEERALFGPTPEQRDHELRLASEAQLRDQLEQEAQQQAAENALTDDEFNALFPPSRDDS